MRDRSRIRTFYIVLIFLISSFPGCTPEPIESSLLLFVDYSNVPENMVLTDYHTDRIEIKVKGHPRLIEMINTESIRYPVDMYTDLEFDPAGDSDSIEPGAYLIPVEETRIPVDPSIQIIEINPSFLSVQLEMKALRLYKVTVPYTGAPSKGYIALEAVTEPSHVELSGSTALLQSIEELRTKPIDITDAREDFKKEVPLDLNDLSLLGNAGSIIKVTVPIQQQLVSKRIEQIPIQIINATGKASIEPENISITIKGPYDTMVNQQVMEQIGAFVDLAQLAPGVYARHAVINIPVGLLMTDAAPQVFTIKIE